MSKADTAEEMAEKVTEVVLTAVMVVLRRDYDWAEQQVRALLAAAKNEVANIAEWLEQGVEQ